MPNAPPSGTTAGGMTSSPLVQVLDNRKTACAVGLIKAARTMAELPVGSVLEVWSRDRFAPMEIPLWADRDGYRIEQLPDGGRWPLRYYIFRITKDR